ncbi:glycosyltransferase [Listeria cornellensis]|uniref:glycosyltransferase n=1 Tax=Listeria cornellensis TaxID=1494961 RepID=UPI0019D381EC|nr:glycosyltransferase [Listeria cornellensis]
MSPSLLEKASELKLTKPAKLHCIGSGSSNGINTDKFQHVASKEMSVLPIDSKDQVIGYVGRLTKDKGIDDLVEAFLLLKETFPMLKLLLVGRLDKDHGLRANTMIKIKMHQDIILLNFQKEVAPFYKKIQVFVFPTHREGFGNVAMEAAYSGLPVVATNVTGAKDTVVHGETGLLTEARNPEELERAIASLLHNPEKASKMGIEGKRRVEVEFKRENVWQGILAMYEL